MEKTYFLKIKSELIILVQERLNQSELTNREKVSLTLVLKILDEYTYENRLRKKGLLTHTILDSLELESSLTEKLLKFDYME